MDTPMPVASPTDTEARPAPLVGIRVIEFTHMVMGPSCGMILADLGADVIKIEPAPKGDNTRKLTGPATGFFPTFNRNKRSLAVDMKKPAGLALVRRLAKTADVLIENFRPGAMDKLGLGYAALAEFNPRLIYCSCKGFLPGPYEHRTALDEVVQMMGGLAYMTGLPDRPLRVGSSVNDIMGGMFGVIAILACLRERDATGRGGLIQSGLFETNMVLVAQHLVSFGGLGEKSRFEIRTEQLAGDSDRARRIQHVHHWICVGWGDTDSGVHFACGGAPDEQRNLETRARHFLGHVHHFIQRRRD